MDVLKWHFMRSLTDRLTLKYFQQNFKAIFYPFEKIWRLLRKLKLQIHRLEKWKAKTRPIYAQFCQFSKLNEAKRESDIVMKLCVWLSAVLVAPSRPEVSAVSQTSVLVQWTMSSSSLAHVTSFRLQYKQIVEDRSSAVWKTVDQDVPAGWRSYEVVQLAPGEANVQSAARLS